ncbi:MAG: phage tail protein [Thiobacillus sp.]|nr:phage tail protein [Thiobacillus sp.]
MSFGGGGTISTVEPKIGALSIQNSAFGLPIGLFWGKARLSGNMMWFGDFTAIPHTTTQSSGGKGGGGVTSQNTTFTYTAAFIFGLSEGPINSIDQVWSGKEKTTFAALGMTLLPGTIPQSVWPHLTTNHPAEALSYPGIASVAHSAFNLGSSASLPNLSFEANGPRQFGSGIVDARPDEIITDMLSSPIYGAGFPASRLSVTAYRTYTQAEGLFLSPVINSQQPAAQHLDDILKATNSAPLWSEGLLKILPYGDTSVTGNGVTYTPAITPVYDLTDDDYFPASKGDRPIKIRRKPVADAYNQLQVEFRNRANEYNIEPAEAKDLGNISAFGLRSAEPVRLHAICEGSIANKVANALLQRKLYIRNEYEFRLCWRHCLLESMDIVTLTHAPLGLDHFQVRIKEVEEDSGGMLRVVAEEFPFGVATPALIQTQQPSGYSVDFSVAPGNANAPVLFEPPMSLAGQGRYELWLATSGGVNWGSAEVWVSWDDATYKRVGVVQGGARHGALSAALASGSDPDTTNTLAVDLSVSRGELISGTLADRDDLLTLCYVDGELISYQTATLTAANKYNLTSLRRGAHGTPVGVHNIDTKFVRLDDAVFRYAYEVSDIGKTLYIKLRSLNTFDSGAEELATLTAYTHTIVGAAEGTAVPPPDVNTFLVSRQSDGTRQFVWSLLNPPADLTGFLIRYKLGTETDWDAMTPMHNGALLASPFESNQLAAGSYTFAIKAIDVFGNESVNATFIQATLGDPRLSGALDVFEERAEGWPGTKTDCHLESTTGYLQPDDTAATPWTGTWASRKWTTTPANPITYERLIDVGVVATFTPLVTVIADGTVTVTEAHSDDGVTYTSFAAITGPITCRYVKIKISVAATWPTLKDATTILSASPISQDTEDLDTSTLTGSYRIGTGDIRIPLTKTFASIRKVDVTLQNVGAGWSWELIDKDTAVGPRLKIYNASNAAADATIDVTVRGL